MNAKRLTDRTFGLTIAGVLIVITALRWLLGFDPPFVLLGIASVMGIVALVYPVALFPMNELFIAITSRIGHVTNAIILGILFFIIIAPLGMIMRRFGWDPLKMRSSSSAQTYFNAVYEQPDANSYKNLF